MVVPIYLAEASPTAIRGRIVTFNVIFITSGLFYNYQIFFLKILIDNLLHI